MRQCLFCGKELKLDEMVSVDLETKRVFCPGDKSPLMKKEKEESCALKYAQAHRDYSGSYCFMILGDVR